MGKKRRKSNTGIPGLSFSWKRATGVTKAKSRFAKATGIPTTRSGRQRKAGKLLGCGCLTLALPLIAIATILALSPRSFTTPRHRPSAWLSGRSTTNTFKLDDC